MKQEDGGSPDPFEVFTQQGLLRIGETDLWGLKGYIASIMAPTSTVVALHLNTFNGTMGDCRVKIFNIMLRAVTEYRDGNANLCCAFYPESKDEICNIIRRGFRRFDENGTHGPGLYLYPTMSVHDCVASSVEDENGLRHILFCKATMGNMEVISAGSTPSLCSPSEFDSGVDNLWAPRRYIVWPCNGNSHILPLFVISFKPHGQSDLNRYQVSAARTTSQQLHLCRIFSALSRILGPAKRALLSEYFDGFQKNKISQLQAYRTMRQITGDDQLFLQMANSVREEFLGVISSKKQPLVEHGEHILEKQTSGKMPQEVHTESFDEGANEEQKLGELREQLLEQKTCGKIRQVKTESVDEAIDEKQKLGELGVQLGGKRTFGKMQQEVKTESFDESIDDGKIKVQLLLRRMHTRGFQNLLKKKLKIKGPREKGLLK